MHHPRLAAFNGKHRITHPQVPVCRCTSGCAFPCLYRVVENSYRVISLWTAPQSFFLLCMLTYTVRI